MFRYFILCLIIYNFSSLVYGTLLIDQKFDKDQPIILLHGFLGYGRNEQTSHLGLYYWGGSIDLQEILRDVGYKVYTAKVGPVSSAWDRACELYAQIKGTRVDYGKKHSRNHDHDRYGKDFTGKGFYPEWGTINPFTGEKRKIRIVAHSQGGTAARMMAHLLERGHDEWEDEKGIISPLFDKDRDTKGLIHSITTLSTPHNGTTIAGFMEEILPQFVNAVILMASFSGLTKYSEVVWDLMLDHFGYYRKEGESLKDYFKRTLNDKRLLYSKDTAYWETTPEGAKELNSWVETLPNVYYFSFANYATHSEKKFSSKIFGCHTGNKSMNPFLIIFAKYMGKYVCNVDDHNYSNAKRCKPNYHSPVEKLRVRVDENWWANDGVVNKVSMMGPSLIKNESKINHSIVDISKSRRKEKIIPGKWHIMGVFKDVDHFDIIGGFRITHNQKIPKSFISNKSIHIKDWYLNLVKFLDGLTEL